MKFTKTQIEGVYVVDLDRIGDSRGFFARAWCAQEMEAAGMNPGACQANLSFNVQAGTVRGMHFQNEPFAEAKLVRCTQGKLFDVCVDLRPDSPTRHQWFGVELTAENHRCVIIPEGCAHGFQTLVDDTEIFYIVSQFYAPEHEGGVHYADPAFGIKWPLSVSEISERDASIPLVEG